MLANSRFTFMSTLTKANDGKIILAVFMVEAGNELTADEDAYTYRVGEEALEISIERFKGYVSSVRAGVFFDNTQDHLWIREPGETIADFAKRLLQCSALGIKPMIPTDFLPESFDPSVN